MAWVYLIAAGILEVGWALGLKSTQGFTRFWPSVWTAAAIIGSMILLAMAARTIPIGVAYAVWTGIGVLGATVLGMAILGEPVSATRLLCLVLILGGVIGLKLTAH